jgi:hypothetical protein
MAYKIKYQSKKRKAKLLSTFIQEVDRKTKENYLMKVGLFKEKAVKEMSDTQLNELVEVAVKIKGFG